MTDTTKLYDLSDRTLLKATRTAYNEYCLLKPNDPGYFAVYHLQTEEQIVEGLKQAVAKQIEADPLWLSRAPNIIVLFADAVGLVGGMDEEEDDEALEEEDELSEEEDDEPVDATEEGELEATDVAYDIEDEEESETEGAEGQSVTEEDAKVEEAVPAVEGYDGPTHVYRICIESLVSTGAVSRLFQEMANAINDPDTDVIEIRLPSPIERGIAVQARPRPVIQKRTDLAPELSVEYIQKALRVGGKLMHRQKRIAFIKEHNIPTKVDPKNMAPKDLSMAIIKWAREQFGE